jgi:DNA-binding NtrC family response regulator
VATGVTARAGLLEQGSGGTVLLDEIAELQPELQAKLLRFLEERTVTRVGGRRPVAVDARVLAATNRDVTVAVAEGALRADLYYRLAGVTLRLPPLRERPEDFDLLVEMLWQREGGSSIECRAVFTPGLQADLQQLAWPGNVRELRHAVSRALLYGRTHGARATRANPGQWLRGIGGTAPAGDDAPAAPRPMGADRTAGGTGSAPQPGHARTPREHAGEWNRETLEAALEVGGGRIAAAAKILGISRSHAYRLFKQLQDAEEDPGDLLDRDRAV